MRALVVREFAPFEQVQVSEIDDPVPGPGEVVVDIVASDANFPDILLVEGKYQHKPRFPFVPGIGGAGRISAVGDAESGFAIGQKVLVLPEYGTHAEKIRAPAAWCFPIPDGVPFDIAAALGLVYQTAYFALIARASFKAGGSVLVLGASGGVGMAAIQLAKAFGASLVIAATRGEAGAAAAREIGADATADSGSENLRDDLRDAVKLATGGKGVDIVIDPVGGAVSEAALRALAWDGRLVVVGFAAWQVPSFKANYLLVKNITVSGLQWTDYRERQIGAVASAQARIFELWAEGKLRPLISRTLPLERVGEAFALLSIGQARGKIILTTAAGDVGA